MIEFPLEVLGDICDAGGSPYIVGGYVRDRILQVESKDADIEVFNMTLEDLEYILSKSGEVDLVGKAFGVLKLHAYPNIDFSIPRSDNKIGVGHKGFRTDFDPKMTKEEAAKRRDLTMNAMYMDPFNFSIFDFYGGQKDMQDRVLRAVDESTFLEDPLRAMRVAQFISRFDYRPDDKLFDICSKADLSELPGERLFEEFKKLLLGRHPREGLQFLYDTGLSKFFPELHALADCLQDEEWHPEGSVATHTVMAVQEARDFSSDLVVLFGTLCHDFGKPPTTEFVDGRWRSRGHEEAGEEPTRKFLEQLRAPNDLIEKVVVLVKNHLAPAMYHNQNSSPKAYRRLARQLASVGLTLETLEKVSRADHLGRTTPDALRGEFKAGDLFLEKIKSLDIKLTPKKEYEDVVMGRHLMELGFKQGPDIGKILLMCREIQDETGMKDPDSILNMVLDELATREQSPK